MVAQARVNVHELMGRKSNCKLNFFSMTFIQNNEEIHFSFKNSEKQWRQALKELETTIHSLEKLQIRKKPESYLSTRENTSQTLHLNDDN